MTTGDQKVESAANKLQQLANQMAGEGGVKAKLAEPLAEDADFIRKLKPSLIKARAKGEAPTSAEILPDEAGAVHRAEASVEAPIHAHEQRLNLLTRMRHSLRRLFNR